MGFRWVVSFMPRPLYLLWESLLYPLNRRFWPQKWQERRVALPGLEVRPLCCRYTCPSSTELQKQNPKGGHGTSGYLGSTVTSGPVRKVSQKKLQSAVCWQNLITAVPCVCT
jgi:hypothetical protein